MLAYRILQPPWLVFWAILLLLPLAWPYGVVLWRYVNPPVSDVEILYEKEDGYGLSFSGVIRNSKCPIAAVAMIKGSRQLPMRFDPPRSAISHEGVGGNYYFGPWKVYGTDTIRGTRMAIVHRCRLWDTVTEIDL